VHTRRQRFSHRARAAFGWFLGDNAAATPVYDPETGGCHDGIGADRARHGEGAASTLAYYQALVPMVASGLAALPR
jgi:hypothetical protein